VVQAVEPLPSKLETLSSIPSPEKGKERGDNENFETTKVCMEAQLGAGCIVSTLHCAPSPHYPLTGNRRQQGS
jgi:hypothetical protein